MQNHNITRMKKILLIAITVFSASALMAQPATPPVPTVSSNICGNKTLTTVAPPANVTYYWQGTSCGTSTTDAALTYSATASGTYYLRAYNTSGQWSTACASVIVSVNPNPATPGTPTVSTNTCGDKVLTRAETPPAGVGYYWQGTSCAQTNTNNSPSYTATASGTYYMVAISSAGCSSPACAEVSVVVNPHPVAPAMYTVSTNSCGPKILTRVAAPPAGIGYYWQGTSCSASMTNALPWYEATATGSYYLQAVSSAGCGSFCVGMEVTVVPYPAIPAAYSVSANLCGDKTLTSATAPVDVNYYWQGSSCGVSQAQLATGPYTATSSGSYYLRAQSTASGCWSPCYYEVVTVNQPPVVSFSGLVGPYLDNEADVALTGNPAGGVFTGTGISGDFFSPSDAGPGDFAITYTYTDGTGCSNFETQMVHVDHFDGISENNFDKLIAVYPNPFRNTLNIEIKALYNESITYSVVNLVGELVKTGQFTNSSTQVLDLSGLDNGVYYLRLMNENFSNIRKIVVQK